MLDHRSALVESGGFTFGLDLEPTHVGEDVAGDGALRWGGAAAQRGAAPGGADDGPERTGDIVDLLIEADRVG